MSSPTISVLMPVKNARKFLHDAIAGVLAQTYRDFELLLIDDGSDDDSLAICQGYAQSDRRISVLQNQMPGIANTLNYGLALAKGRYMARVDADDVCVVDRFKRQIAVLEANPDIAVVGASAWVIDGQGVEIGVLKPPTNTAQIRLQLLSTNCVIHPTVMARLVVVQGIGGYRPVFEGCEDYDLWLRITSIADILNLGDMLLYYRMHDGQVSWQRTEQRIFSELAATRCAIDRHLEQCVDLDKLTVIDRDTLLAIGLKPAEIAKALQVRSIGTVLDAIRFQQYQTAQSLLAQLQGQCAMPFKRGLACSLLRLYLGLRSYFRV
ncbi:MAG: glycosyltransferase [Methylococcaceae bacterium]|jgi:glycosyltransferase involved in cell wall biosynthesis